MPAALKYHPDLAPESQWRVVSATEAARASLPFAQEIGEFFAGPQYFTTREGLDSFLIMLTVEGCGVLEYDDQKHRLPPGRFFWIDCGRHQHYYTDPAAKSWHVMWVHFCNARTLYNAYLGYTNGAPAATLTPDSEALDVFQALLTPEPAGANPMMADYRAADLLNRLATECILSAMTINETRNVPETVRAVAQYLAEHYREKHTLESLGARFNINPFYLQKQFKRLMGLSPAEYHTFQRMARAKMLMRSTRKSIGEIALEIGMDSLGYFSRLFRQQEGMTPHEYRRLWPVFEQGFGQERPPEP